MNAGRINDFLTFAQWHVRSGDVDPAYPVLRWVIRELDLSADEAVSFTMLYVSTYNLTSAINAWVLDGWRIGCPTPASAVLPCATERRGHRSPAAILRHWDSLSTLHGRYGSWKSAIAPVDGTPPREGWLQTQAILRAAIFGNGRWAAYKVGEILKVVHGWAIDPTDAGHDFSTGPRKGLADIFPQAAELTGATPVVVQQLDKLTGDLVAMTGYPVETVETNLCDFHSLVNGHYYVGHDIDQQYEQTVRSEGSRAALMILAARRSSFDERWLCEVNDWKGVRADLRTLYRDSGLIEWWRS